MMDDLYLACLLEFLSAEVVDLDRLSNCELQLVIRLARAEARRLMTELQREKEHRG